MIAKALAVVSLIILPLSIAFWHRSHVHPARYRLDVTLYKSLEIYLKDGVCGLHLLSMPTKTASRTEFLAPISYNAVPNQASLLLTTSRKGPYRTTWIVFPFWLSTNLLLLVGLIPVVRRPATRWWRKRRGRCVECGYDLTGNRSGRCPECGDHFAAGGVRPRPVVATRR